MLIEKKIFLEILSDENQSVRSPKLSLDGNTLFWMQRPAGGPHDACQEIVKYDLKTGEVSIAQ